MNNTTKSSLRLTLIHNNNERYPSARQTIEKLGELARSQWNTEISEVSWQPELVPHGRFRALWQMYLNSLLVSRWQEYLGLPKKERSLWRSHRNAVRQIVDHIIHKNKLIAWCRQRAIEMALTDKHVRGWQTFLDSNCGYLLTMEDDAALHPDTADTFLQALAILEQYSPKDDLVYFDLAGGLDTSGLQIDPLKRDLEQNRFRRMSKITTNTACCFIMSRALVEDFAARVQKRPHYRKVVSDWLINTLLIDQAATDQRPHYCLHAEPPIMIHGSIQGLYASTIRDLDD